MGGGRAGLPGTLASPPQLPFDVVCPESGPRSPQPYTASAACSLTRRGFSWTTVWRAVKGEALLTQPQAEEGWLEQPHQQGKGTSSSVTSSERHQNLLGPPLTL